MQLLLRLNAVKAVKIYDISYFGINQCPKLLGATGAIYLTVYSTGGPIEQQVVPMICNIPYQGK